MNLIKAELSRFFSRRFIQIMLVVLAAAFAITVMTVMGGSQTPSPYMLKQATEQAEAHRGYLEREFAECMERQRDPRNPDAAKGPARCADLDPNRVRVENYLWGVFNFSREIGDLVMLLSVFLACFGFLVTASFIGSELHSGGMTNLLLWRPNRMAVLGAKMGVAIGVVTALTAIYTAIYVGTFYAIADTTGWVGGTHSPFWSELFWLCARAVGLAVALSFVAFAIAVIGRHTAAALGALIGYFVVWEIGARVVLEALHSYRYETESWFFSRYLYIWLEGRTPDRYAHYDPVPPVTWGESVAALLVVVGVSIAVAFGTFRRRDLA